MTKIKENNGDDIGAAAASAARLPDEETLCEVAELFKLFADSTRIRILYALAAAGELSVTGIAEELEMSQSAISHQLRARPADPERRRKNMFYSRRRPMRTILGMGTNTPNNATRQFEKQKTEGIFMVDNTR